MTSLSTEEPKDRERRQRVEATERELASVLRSDSISDVTRKRQLVGLFDQFRAEYTQLSLKLRETLRHQRRLANKCVQLKNELVVCALRIQSTEQGRVEAIKSLEFYRDEWQHAWKQQARSQERERDAMRMVEELKRQVAELQMHVMDRRASAASPRFATSPCLRKGGSCDPEVPTSSLRSPVVRDVVVSPTRGLNSRSKGSFKAFTMPALLSFDAWKASTSLGGLATPLAVQGAPQAATRPLEAYSQDADCSQAIARCGSMPTMHPTFIQRVNSLSQRQRPQGESAAVLKDTTRARTAPAFVPSGLERPIRRQGGIPASKRRVPRQLPHVS